MAAISLGASPTNAHIIDISSASDLERHLESIGAAPSEIPAITDRFLYRTLKLEGVDVRAATVLREHLESLGGAVALGREVREPPTRDMIITGSRQMLRLLARRLEGETRGLDAIGAALAARYDTEARVMSWGLRTLDFTRKTYVMGILNCTPDSFYPGSRATTLDQAVSAAKAMIAAGADIIDLGGESSRPGSDPVPADEEIRRVVPVIEAIRAFSQVPLSIDSCKADVAARALDAGADMVNDISGLHQDPELGRLVARRGVPIVLMHMRGTPKTMQDDPHFDDTVSEILGELEQSVAAALACGVPRELIIIDPGIGFGKRMQDNLRIIGELASLKSLNLPILVGLSRKSFIGQITGRPVEERLVGTVTANTLAVVNGANIVRVHDVAEAVEMLKIIDSVRRTGT